MPVKVPKKIIHNRPRPTHIKRPRPKPIAKAKTKLKRLVNYLYNEFPSELLEPTSLAKTASSNPTPSTSSSSSRQSESENLSLILKKLKKKIDYNFSQAVTEEVANAQALFTWLENHCGLIPQETLRIVLKMLPMSKTGMRDEAIDTVTQDKLHPELETRLALMKTENKKEIMIFYLRKIQDNISKIKIDLLNSDDDTQAKEDTLKDLYKILNGFTEFFKGEKGRTFNPQKWMNTITTLCKLACELHIDDPNRDKLHLLALGLYQNVICDPEYSKQFNASQKPEARKTINKIFFDKQKKQLESFKQQAKGKKFEIFRNALQSIIEDLNDDFDLEAYKIHVTKISMCLAYIPETDDKEVRLWHSLYSCQHDILDYVNKKNNTPTYIENDTELSEHKVENTKAKMIVAAKNSYFTYIKEAAKKSGTIWDREYKKADHGINNYISKFLNFINGVRKENRSIYPVISWLPFARLPFGNKHNGGLNKYLATIKTLFLVANKTLEQEEVKFQTHSTHEAAKGKRSESKNVKATDAEQTMQQMCGKYWKFAYKEAKKFIEDAKHDMKNPLVRDMKKIVNDILWFFHYEEAGQWFLIESKKRGEYQSLTNSLFVGNLIYELDKFEQHNKKAGGFIKYKRLRDWWNKHLNNYAKKENTILIDIKEQLSGCKTKESYLNYIHYVINEGILKINDYTNECNVFLKTQLLTIVRDVIMNGGKNYQTPTFDFTVLDKIEVYHQCKKNFPNHAEIPVLQALKEEIMNDLDDMDKSSVILFDPDDPNVKEKYIEQEGKSLVKARKAGTSENIRKIQASKKAKSDARKIQIFRLAYRKAFNMGVEKAKIFVNCKSLFKTKEAEGIRPAKRIKQLVDKAIPLPGLPLITQMLFEKYSAQRESRRKKQFFNIAKQFIDAREYQKIAERTANELAWRFEQQITMLETDSVEQFAEALATSNLDYLASEDRKFSEKNGSNPLNEKAIELADIAIFSKQERGFYGLFELPDLIMEGDEKGIPFKDKSFSIDNLLAGVHYRCGEELYRCDDVVGQPERFGYVRLRNIDSEEPVVRVNKEFIVELEKEQLGRHICLEDEGKEKVEGKGKDKNEGKGVEGKETLRDRMRQHKYMQSLQELKETKHEELLAQNKQLKVKTEEQGAEIKEQGTTIKEQGTTIKEQGATIEEQRETIKKQGAAIKQQNVEIQSLKKNLNLVMTVLGLKQGKTSTSAILSAQGMFNHNNLLAVVGNNDNGAAMFSPKGVPPSNPPSV